MRTVGLISFMLVSGGMFGQGLVRSDAAYVPDLLPQTTTVRSILPLADGRNAIIQFWETPSGFQNVLGCLTATGDQVVGFDSPSDAIALYPWADPSTFYCWHAYYPDHVQRHYAFDGVVDTSFRINAMASSGTYHINDLTNVKVDDQGRVYLIGTITLTDTVNGLIGVRNLVRLDQSGALDLTFPPASCDHLLDVFPMPDGSMLLSGWQTSYNDIAVPLFFKVHGDGSIDTGFHTTFIQALPSSVLPLPDGGAIATGQFVTFISLIELDTSYVVKFLQDGSIDPSFHQDLHAHQDLYGGYYTRVNSIIPWDADHYLISGNFDRLDGIPKRGLALIGMNGDLEVDECTWPGPGSTDDGVDVHLVACPNGGAFAYGTFSGFNDGTIDLRARGLVHLIDGDMGMIGPDDGPMYLRPYPMPAQDHVSFAVPSGMGEAIISLVDASGRSLRTWSMIGECGTADLALDGVLPGRYVLRIISSQGAAYAIPIQVAP